MAPEPRITLAAIYDLMLESTKEVGYPPTMSEIGKMTGLSSRATVWKKLIDMENLGWIERDPGVIRGIRFLR